jgi:superfamily II DNA or RNA helicase
VDVRLRLRSAEEVRARIARVILGKDTAHTRIGAISLQPHQLSAVTRIESAIDEFGGALLCDEVGMGKTFVATAIAGHYNRRLVVAPAALSRMWTHALHVSEIEADFVSFEKLSRLGSSRGAQYDLLIVDEAHHVRNKATRRYARLQELSRETRLLLLTATPIHNRRKDLLTLLSLFLGSRADALTQPEIARCIVRREHDQLKGIALRPRVRSTVAVQISDDPRIVRDLMMLPDPLPVRGGGLGRSLIGRSLVHQWASSEAALGEALRRRIARSYALISSLEVGTYPTDSELRTWIFDDGALQLGFPELLSAPVNDASDLLECVKRHSSALERIHTSRSPESSLDTERAEAIAEVRAAHPEAKIVAFAQYTETVDILFRKLVKFGGVAMLTAHGARVAGGKLSRGDALLRFAPRALGFPPTPRAESIDLLLSTDLLSEGVNLQDAEVVIHLDIPWTAARLEQRVGRVARMGSTHSEVSVYLIRPPASAAALLKSETLVRRKWNITRSAIGSAGSSPFPVESPREGDTTEESVTKQTEKLRAILNEWRRPLLETDSDEVSVASVSSRSSGFIAAVSIDAQPSLVAALDQRLSTDIGSQIIAGRLSCGGDVETSSRDYRFALQQLREWAERERASAMAGLTNSSTMQRRRVVNRIDAAIERAPPHSRGRRLIIAARARRVASSQLSAAVEAELEFLSRASLPDDEWLEALAKLESSREESLKTGTTNRGLVVHALLLLTQDSSSRAQGLQPK